MRHQQLAQTAPAMWVEKESSLPFIIRGRHIALDHDIKRAV